MEILRVLLLVCLTMKIGVFADGQRDYGETCSLRSQIANYFRANDSPQGCMTDKGLVCVSHKCVCDPTSIYLSTSPSSSPSDSSSRGGFRASIGNLFKKAMGSSTTTSTQPSVPTTITVGRCYGRAGSPCLTETSACVEHAKCQGSPKICRCQGIYSSNTQGLCSKRATVANEAIKYITGRGR